MSVQIRGIVNGRQIELDRETGLPSGSIVTVSIEQKPLSLDEKRTMADALCGAWAGDSSIPDIFSSIEHERGLATPREANFDAPS